MDCEGKDNDAIFIQGRELKRCRLCDYVMPEDEVSDWWFQGKPTCKYCLVYEQVTNYSGVPIDRYPKDRDWEWYKKASSGSNA